MTRWADQLNQMKLGDFPGLYRTLKVPEITALNGYYRGTFVGPSWLRTAAGPGLVVSGLGGWWGKRFHGDGTAINLVEKGDLLQPKFPMRLVDITSSIDGKPGLALHYNTENPFPWPQIADELRQLDSGAYLGMTYVRATLLRGLTLPFLLQYQENFNGL